MGQTIIYFEYICSNEIFKLPNQIHLTSLWFMINFLIGFSIRKCELKPTYNFPVLRGIQARSEYYIAMCPLKLVPKLFLYDEEPVPPDLRAQRTLNKARIPEMALYLSNNPGEYVFSAITASIGCEVDFEPVLATYFVHGVSG